MAAIGSLLFLLQLCVCSYTQTPSVVQTKQFCNGTDVQITCNTLYIHVTGVFYGFLNQTIVSSYNDSNICPTWNTTTDCFNEPGNSRVMDICHGNSTCQSENNKPVEAQYTCNAYQNTSTYLIVQYTCEKNMPTTTPTTTTPTTTTPTTTTPTTTTPTTTTTAAPTTRWAPPTTTEYVNFLSTGAQAGIIVAIMVGLTIIFAAITVYKCVKYGPSDDTRKFFSKAPEPGAIDDPKIIPWVPGEAQEEIYRNITEKAKAKSKKKRKFKF